MFFKCLAVRGATEADAEINLRLYADAIDDLPIAEVSEVLRDFRTGRLGDGKWAPKPGEIRIAVQERQRAGQESDYAYRMRKLAEDQVRELERQSQPYVPRYPDQIPFYHSPEERAARAAAAASSGSQHRERTPAEKASVQRMVDEFKNGLAKQDRAKSSWPPPSLGEVGAEAVPKIIAALETRMSGPVEISSELSELLAVPHAGYERQP